MLTIKMRYEEVIHKVSREIEWERQSDDRRNRLYLLREMLRTHAPHIQVDQDVLIDVDEELYKFLDF